MDQYEYPVLAQKSPFLGEYLIYVCKNINIVKNHSYIHVFLKQFLLIISLLSLVFVISTSFIIFWKLFGQNILFYIWGVRK